MIQLSVRRTDSCTERVPRAITDHAAAGTRTVETRQKDSPGTSVLIQASARTRGGPAGRPGYGPATIGQGAKLYLGK
eukprot:62183-Hanusia_phi.AAC.1